MKTHSILWVEDVRGGGVVQDEDFVELPAQAAQVLYIAALVEDAGLPEETSPEDPTLVEQICYWICILKQERKSQKEGQSYMSENLNFERLKGLRTHAHRLFLLRVCYFYHALWAVLIMSSEYYFICDIRPLPLTQPLPGAFQLDTIRVADM